MRGPPPWHGRSTVASNCSSIWMEMNDKLKVVVVGIGQMGTSRALVYHNNPDFQIIQFT